MFLLSSLNEWFNVSLQRELGDYPARSQWFPDNNNDAHRAWLYGQLRWLLSYQDKKQRLVLPDNCHNCEFLTSKPTVIDVVSCMSCLMKIRHCDCIIEQFMALLVLRHTLPLMIGDNGEYSLALFAVRLTISIHRYLLVCFKLVLTWCLLLCILLLEIKLLVLRTAGILFPILVMVRALASFHRRRRQQVISLPSHAVSNAILIMFSLAAADMAELHVTPVEISPFVVVET